MKKNKTKWWIAVLAGAMLALTACGGETQSESSVVQETVEGTTENAGEIQALCPSGWTSLGNQDLTAAEADTLRTDSLRFVKGGSVQDDVLTNATIEITVYASKDEIPETDASALYDSVAETGEITTGTHVWSGYSASSMGKPFVYLECESQDAAFSAYLWTQEGSENAAALTDTDVQAILASVVSVN